MDATAPPPGSVVGPLTVETISGAGTTTLRMAGEFDLSDVPTARAALEQALAVPTSSLIIDLRRVEFIDASGVAFLVAVIRDHGEAGLDFIPSQSGSVRRLLSLIGLTESLEPRRAAASDREHDLEEPPRSSPSGDPSLRNGSLVEAARNVAEKMD